MLHTTADSPREAVWVSMAEHFLDTETRHGIPLTALCCIEAGLTPAQARRVWQEEVDPAVGFNLRSVAGEWAGWETQWLVSSIRRQRRARHVFRPFRWLSRSLSSGTNDGVWLSIERCMEQLLDLPTPEQRRELAQDLTVLAGHYFDFGAAPLSRLEPAQRARVRQLDLEVVLELLQPALVSSERSDAPQRVHAAMAEPPPIDLAHLRRRFDSAARAVGAGAGVEPLFDELVGRYRESARHYHTLEHVSSCLAWLDWYYGLAERPAEVTLALWFHDAVYDPRAFDNEARSAELARTKLAALGVSAEACSRIAQYVEATKAHASGSGDAALVVDIDLAILAARPPAFDDFEQAIRHEYAHVDDASFNAGRRHVLQSFLDRPQIYRLPPLRDALERPARANLEKRIRELGAAVRGA